MRHPRIVEIDAKPLAVLRDPEPTPGVRFGFSTREGGVSKGPFASLNLSEWVGDDPHAVAENRRRLIRAIRGEDDPSVEELANAFLAPHQVHGTNLVVVRENTPDALAKARAAALAGADGVVLAASGVPALICTADCVPVVLVAPGAVAVVHSGWKGTLTRISALALERLCALSGCASQDVVAYLGPHIQVSSYEVSPELAQSFVNAFGENVVQGKRHLSLASAIVATLVEKGLDPALIACSCASTAQEPDRYFSYRALGSPTGRQGVLAWLS